jgi:hypothetical protein
MRHFAPSDRGVPTSGRRVQMLERRMPRFGHSGLTHRRGLMNRRALTAQTGVISNRVTQRFDEVMAMDSNGHPEEKTMAIRLRQLLLEMARREDEIARSEATAVPYWAPHPSSVIGHRAAAEALRSEADGLLSASRRSRG